MKRYLERPGLQQYGTRELDVAKKKEKPVPRSLKINLGSQLQFIGRKFYALSSPSEQEQKRITTTQKLRSNSIIKPRRETPKEQ